MYKTTINALFLSFLFCNAVAAQADSTFKFKPRPQEFELYGYQNDSLIQLKQIPNNAALTFESKLPYPIIFIHGLNSSSETWNATTNYFDSQYAFTYGGRFDFCLNADGNNTTANKNFYPTPGADIAAFESSVTNGDYYYVNFNVKVDGSWETNVLSNQSAIAKQGAALKKAVERVLQLTGKDKVVLVGHSMGGLCSREYIQNSFNWQADNYHHVAKLLTVGTPHGGSNASDNPIAVFTSVDRQSEAVRDLKTTYYYSGDAGKFLFGGTEVLNSSSMNDNSYSPDFYNLDVNCNGVAGDAIQGLNQKPIDNLIDFSNVIGRITNFIGTNVTTDGVVEEPSSNMNTYFPTLTYPAKIFYFNSGYDLIENHTELPGYYYQIMQGLDEPNFKELAYEISTNKNYIGFTTVQANSSNPDNDYFKFNVADNVNATVLMSSIVTSSMNASILNSSGTAIGSAQNNTGSTLSFTRTLEPGNYFLKITSTNPTNTNYQTPYQFSITSTLSAADNLIADFRFYPNPVKDILHLDNLTITKASVYSIVGQLIDEMEFTATTTSNTIDMSGYANGIYLIKLQNGNREQTVKVIKE
ncbi:T9SS type A sorting domain-containing protein [Flavobacterium suncheonense]|uniref:Esterase n=1 Tax=Flavobacterium suncheonense GH29-5 = DSM 17707 TaxID=1121899 RepID=A0A0A2MGW7_9FLAO|nr:alpha/beta fold hydrolase [Flavobacterium suncheonense]KGO90856.1 esterase [Flavobacterium suncheonense GH29-5 = DSM 17707]